MCKRLLLDRVVGRHKVGHRNAPFDQHRQGELTVFGVTVVEGDRQGWAIIETGSNSSLALLEIDNFKVVPAPVDLFLKLIAAHGPWIDGIIRNAMVEQSQNRNLSILNHLAESHSAIRPRGHAISVDEF